jgi:hypothetical protein
MLDPVMKSVGQSLEGVLPLIVLSTSYYSYVFAPVVLAVFLCVGFRHLRGIKVALLSVVLVLITLKPTWNSAAELAMRAMPDLSIVREVADELNRSGAGRAVVVSVVGRDLEWSKFRLPLLAPNHFATYGVDMADGFLPNPTMLIRSSYRTWRCRDRIQSRNRSSRVP